MFRRHQWDRPRRRPGRQPKCGVCGQGAASWVNDFLRIWVVDGGTWGSHVPVRHVHTFFCPGTWTGNKEYYRGAKGWVANGPPRNHPPVSQEDKKRYRTK